MRDNAALLEDVSNQTRDATGMLKIGNEQQNVSYNKQIM